MAAVSFLWCRGCLLDELFLQQKTEKVSWNLDTCGLPCVCLEASAFVPASETWEALEDRNVFNLGFACYRLVWPRIHFQSHLWVCCRAHGRGSYRAKWHFDLPRCWTSLSLSVMGKSSWGVERWASAWEQCTSWWVTPSCFSVDGSVPTYFTYLSSRIPCCSCL